MTNFPNGIGSSGVPVPDLYATNVVSTSVNATSIIGTNVNATTLISTTAKIGSSGDTINTIKTYTTTNTNVAAINVADTVYQTLNVSSAGLTNGDVILGIEKTSHAAGIQVLGGYVSAANTATLLLYSATNTNAHVDTFKICVKR